MKKSMLFYFNLSQDKFKEILEAYKTLSDENLRRKYDNDQDGNQFGQNNQNTNDFNPHGRGDFNSGGKAYRRSYTFYQAKPKPKKSNEFDYDNSQQNPFILINNNLFEIKVHQSKKDFLKLYKEDPNWQSSRNHSKIQ